MKTHRLIAILLFSSILATAQTSKREKHFNVEDRVAIQGYDPTTYFVQHKAAKGKKDLSYAYEGITYYFSSSDSRNLFIREPEKFEPQYGGWCAYAMGATGEKVEVDPETFKVVDGKLYLFYNSFFNNTLPKWNAAERDLKAKADSHWKSIFVNP